MILQLRTGQTLLIGDDNRVAFVSIDDFETVTLQVVSPLYPSIENAPEAVDDEALNSFIAGDGIATC